MMRTPSIALLLAALAGAANAAEPATATLSCADAASCAAAQIGWTGRFEAVLAPGLAEQCALPGACDRFRLEVDLPAGYWASNPGSVEVAIRWASASTDRDIDLFVVRDGVEVARSAGQDSASEVAFLEAPENGVYDILVVPVSLSIPLDYEGRIEIEPARFDPNASPVDLLPNLQTLAPHTVRIATAEYLIDPVHDTVVSCYPEEVTDEDENTPTRCLRFDQIVANAGAGPLELRYVPSGPEPDLEQIIYQANGETRRVTADEAELHPIHGHWHYKGFGLGRLYDTGGNLLRQSSKKGFCLIDVEFEAWGEKGNGPRQFSFPGCQTPNDPETGEVVQGIGVGWADVYNWFLADQFVDVTGLPDGIYRLEIVADPENTIIESDESDNAGSVWICLEGFDVEKVSGPGAVCPRTRNLGHRGTGTNTADNPYPENTNVSFRKALAEGADGVELDVQLAADDGDGDRFDELVIMHDESLTRTTTCKGAALDRSSCVESRTIDDIRTNCLPVNASGETALEAGLTAIEERVPTLAEALRDVFATKPDAIVNIEIKSQPPTDGDSIQELCNSADPLHRSTALTVELLNTLEFAGKKSRIVISSFDPTAVALAERMDPGLETAYLALPLRDTGGRPELPDATYAAVAAKALNLDGLHPNEADTTAEVAEVARALALRVRPWTVNDRCGMRRLIDLGVDAIITDEPDLLAEELANPSSCP